MRTFGDRTEGSATVGTFAYFYFCSLLAVYHVFVGIGTEWLR